MTPTTEYDFFKHFAPDDQAAIKYINILHHNYITKKSGYVFQVIFDGNRVINHRAYDDLTEVITANTYGLSAPSVYCSMHRFCYEKRNTEHLFAITGMVIDLDEHDKTGSSLDEIKNNTISKLNKLFNSGALLEPTMIVDSGRGLHIYYILDRPIANVDKNASFKEYYKFIYDKVIRAYQDELSNGDYLQVDKKATSYTQLIRIPGFKNSKAGKMARLYDNEVKYYSVDEIKTGCKLDERFNIHPDSHVTTVVKSAKSFLVTERKYLGAESTNLQVEINADRLEIFEKIQKLFTSRGVETGYREQLAFYYYNSACIVDRSKAINWLMSFNSAYLIPLDDKALNSIIKTVDKVKNNYGEVGWYPISNQHIIDKLELSAVDAHAVGIGLSRRRIQRKRAKKETRDKRDRRSEIIKNIRTMYPKLDRTETLSKVNDALFAESIKTISLPTLSRICKDLGLSFYGTSTKNEAESESIRDTICDNANVIEKTELSKSGKVCNFYNTVDFSDKPDHKTLDEALSCLAAIKNKLDDTSAYIVDYFITYVKSLTLKEKHNLRLEAAIMFIVNEYKDYFWPEQILYDLDHLFSKLQKGQYINNIKVHDISVPPSIYIDGNEWILRPCSNEHKSDRKHSSLQRSRLNKDKDIEYNHSVRDYNALLTFEDWCRNNGFAPLYNALYDEDPTLLLKLKNCSRMKIKKIFATWSDRLLSKPSAEIINEMIIAEFHTSRNALIIPAPHISEKQKAARKQYVANRKLWNWIFQTQKSTEEAKAAELYRTINRYCKDNPNTILYIDGNSYIASYIKKEILYPTTIDDLIYIAKTKPSCEEELLKSLLAIKNPIL